MNIVLRVGSIVEHRTLGSESVEYTGKLHCKPISTERANGMFNLDDHPYIEVSLQGMTAEAAAFFASTPYVNVTFDPREHDGTH